MAESTFNSVVTCDTFYVIVNFRTKTEPQRPDSSRFYTLLLGGPDSFTVLVKAKERLSVLSVSTKVHLGALHLNTFLNRNLASAQLKISLLTNDFCLT